LGRSSIAVSDEIASELSNYASIKNQTSYALANESLGAALKIYERGGTADEIYEAWVMNHIGKDIHAFQWIGRDLMERLIHKLGQLDPEDCSHIWSDAGYNFGVYLQICYPSIEDVLSLTAMLKQSFNIGRVSLIERDQEEDQIYTLSVVTSFSEESLKCLADYWKGLLSAYGLQVKESRIATGSVKLSFICRGKLQKVAQILR